MKNEFIYILLSLSFLISDDIYIYDWKSEYSNARLDKAFAELQAITNSEPEDMSRLNKHLLSEGFAVLVELGKVDSFYKTLSPFQINEIVPIVDYQGALCGDSSYFDKYNRIWNDKLESLWLKWKKNKHLRELCNGVWGEGEEFRDTMGNGVWDEGEEFRDTMGNSVWDEGEEFMDALNEVWDKNEYFYDYGEDNCMDPWEDGKGDCLSRISKDYTKGDDPNRDNYTPSNPDGSQWNWSYNLGEYFIDAYNGIYDEGEEFTDLPDGAYSIGEWFEDLPDGAYSIGEQFVDLPCKRLTPSCYEYYDEIEFEDFSDYEAYYGDAPSPNYKKQYYFRYDQKPVLLNPLCIDYPSSAKTRNVEGEVILEGSISSKGNVSHYPSIDIIKRTGTVLDQAAIDAFIFSLWEPAISKDRPIKTKYRLKIEFSLDSDCIKIEEFRDP